MAAVLCGPTFAKTAGAQIPVDGGTVRVIQNEEGAIATDEISAPTKPDLIDATALDLVGYQELTAAGKLAGGTRGARAHAREARAPGDDGSGQPTCDGSALVQAVSTPAVDPLVTAVGGTELDAADYTTADPGAYQGETVWNEPGIGAGGGGFSLLYSEPSYQEGTINGGHQLGVPDVAYNAAVEHGVLTYLDIPGLPVAFFLFGGTSAGSPQWSAITAIADQKNGADLGFINKALYHIGQASPHGAMSYHDVTVGNNSFAGIPGFSAAAGWDAATGLGSPQAPGLVDLLIQLVSPGDAQSAIAQSAGKTNKNGHGHMNTH